MTLNDLVKEMWCRGLDYDNLLFYARLEGVEVAISKQEYDKQCCALDAEMINWFKFQYPELI